MAKNGIALSELFKVDSDEEQHQEPRNGIARSELFKGYDDEEQGQEPRNGIARSELFRQPEPTTQPEPQPKDSGSFWDSAIDFAEKWIFPTALPMLYFARSSAPALLGGTGAEIVGNVAKGLADNTPSNSGQEYPLGSWRRNLLESISSGAQNVADTLLKIGSNEVEVGDNDTYRGSFGNAFESGAYGVGGGLASMLHADKSANALNNAAQALTDQTPIDPAFSLDYFISPHGLTRSFGQMLGSMATIAPTMFLVPEATAARGVAALGGTELTNFLLNRGLFGAARAFSKGAPNALRYATTSSFVEGGAEGGNVRTSALEQGLSEEEATRRSIYTMAANVPTLIASNFAEGLLLGAPFLGSGGSISRKALEAVARWQLNAAQQGIEEGTQRGIQDWQMGRPYSFNPFKYSPEQAQEAWEGYFGTLPMGIAPAISHVTSNPETQAWERGSDEKISNKDFSARANKVGQNLRTWTNRISDGQMSDGVFNSIVRNAQELGYSPEEIQFALALATAESNGRQDDISPVGAIGVMQLMPETAASLGVDPHDQEQNIRGGLIYLKQQLERYNGDWNLAAAAYNAGPGNVTDHVPQNGETEHYVERINSYLDKAPDYQEGAQIGTERTVYLGQNGAGEGKTWIRNPNMNVSTEGMRPESLNALDMLAKWFYDRTGTPLILNAGTNGDHEAGEHSHAAGWKFDIIDQLDGDGALFTADYRAQPFLKEFVEYGRSLGLGMNLENEGTSNVHLDVAVDGTQWDGNGDHAGGFNPRGVKNTSRKSSTQENSYDNNFTDRQNEIWQWAQYASQRLRDEYKIRLAPELIYRQWALEDGGDFTHSSRNWGGLKDTSGNFRTFASDKEYADAYVDDFMRLRPEINNVTDENGMASDKDFTDVMLQTGYITQGDYNNYINGLPNKKAPNAGRATSMGAPSSQTSQQTKPLFDLNAEDDATQKLFEQFAEERRRSSQDATEVDFFDGMFTDKGKFQNTPENRNAIRQNYGNEFSAWAIAQLQQNQQQAQPTQPATTQTQQSNEYLNNAPIIEAADKFLAQLRAKGNDNKTLLELQQARNSGDIAKIENILKQHNVPISSPQSQQTAQPVQSNTTPKNVLPSPTQTAPQQTQSAQTSPQQQTQPQISQATQDRLNRAATSPISAKRSERIKQGKAIKALSAQNNITLPQPVDIALDNGSVKGIQAAQEIIREQLPQQQTANAQPTIIQPQQQRTVKPWNPPRISHTEAQLQNQQAQQIQQQQIQSQEPTVQQATQAQTQPSQSTLQNQEQTLQAQEQVTTPQEAPAPQPALQNQPQTLQEQTQPTTTQPQPNISSKIRGHDGKQAKVVTQSKTKHNVRYRVVESGDLIASGELTNQGVFNNDEYSNRGGIQPRDRTTQELQADLYSQANNIDPDLALDSGLSVNSGAPVVRNDGVVFNGNGRVMALTYAYKNGKADAYKQALIERADEFGLNADDIAQMNSPVLVRELTNDVTQEELNDIAGTTAGGAASVADEQAFKDAKKIRPETLQLFPKTEIDEKVDLTAAKFEDFVAAVLHDIATSDEMPALSKNGKLTKAGLDRVQRALFALAYGDPKLVETVSTSTDDTARNVTAALTSSAIEFAKVRAGIESGDLANYDLSAITDAVNKLAALRKQNKPVKDYLNEIKLGEQDSEEMRQILSALDKFKRSQPKLTQFLKGLARRMREQGSTADTLFGAAEPAAMLDLINQSRNAVASNNEADLFAQQEEQSNATSQTTQTPQSTRTEEDSVQDAQSRQTQAQKVASVFDPATLHAKFKTDTHPHLKKLLDDILSLDKKFAGGYLQQQLVSVVPRTITDAELARWELVAKTLLEAAEIFHGNEYTENKEIVYRTGFPYPEHATLQELENWREKILAGFRSDAEKITGSVNAINSNNSKQQEVTPESNPAQESKPKSKSITKELGEEIFGNEEDNWNELRAEFGITDEDTQEQTSPESSQKNSATSRGERKSSERQATSEQEIENSDDEITEEIPDSWDVSDEELEKLERDFGKMLNRLSANPMFDPKVWAMGLKLGKVYLARGFKKFSEWAKQLISKLGEKVKPWLSALWETLKSLPKNANFGDNATVNVAKVVGNLYSRGVTDLGAIKAEFAKQLGNNKELLKKLEPLIESEYNGIKKFYEENFQNEEAAENVDDSTDGMAQRTGRRDNQDGVGQDDAIRRPDEQSRPSVPEDKKEARAQRSVRVSNGGTVASRETGNRGVQREKSDDSTGSTRSTELSRGVRDNLAGNGRLDDGREAESVGTSQERPDNETAKQSIKKSDTAYKAGNLNSIQTDLPQLLPEQQQDVAFMEERLINNGGQGVLLTNGTGTGKTFSGLGLVKRFFDNGKKNILIIAPSDGVISQWIAAAKKFFNLDVYKLKDTKDNGSEGQICITTYENVQANKELVARNWDAIFADESHKLSQGKKPPTKKNKRTGKSEKQESTGILKMLRALTFHPRNLYERFKLLNRTAQIRKLENEISVLNRKVQAEREKRSPNFKQIDDWKEQIESREIQIDKIYLAMNDKWEALIDDVVKIKSEDRPKVVFLSATPFSYAQSTDYAEGYLFEYTNDAGYTANHILSGLLRDKKALKSFYSKGLKKHLEGKFGFKFIDGNMVEPWGDNRVREVAFHDELVDSGVMHGRQISIDKDYDRGFLLVDGGIGKTIDEGFEILKKEFPDLYKVLSTQFNRKQQRFLLESIKAKSAVQLARDYVKRGRKVVIFHQAMKSAKPIEPFTVDLKVVERLSNAKEVDANAVAQQMRKFKKKYPKFANLNLATLPSPMETFEKEFGDNAVFYDGEHTKTRLAGLNDFNSDTGSKKIIVVQQDAGNAGISLHDTTGKFPRVLINISIPDRPSYAMQIEGRIYRVGNASNAVFRYLSTGTDMEHDLFATSIGGRAETVENLALGELARGLRNSFKNLFLETESDAWHRRKPGHPEEGTGGKELDRVLGDNVNAWGQALKLYRERLKKLNSIIKVPEPIALKMVEWLGLRDGERVLDPSAGDGVISRWFSKNTRNTIIETDSKNIARAQVVTPNVKIFPSSFDNFNIINKFEGIVLAPPIGKADEYASKAVKHLADGGRLIIFAPISELRSFAFLSSVDEPMTTIADIAFRSGKVNGKTYGVAIIDKYTDSKNLSRIYDETKSFRNEVEIFGREFGTADEYLDDFDDLQDIKAPPRIEVNKPTSKTQSKPSTKTPAREESDTNESIKAMQAALRESSEKIINDAAKNPDVARALYQLGATIKNGKVTFPDDETFQQCVNLVNSGIVKSSQEGNTNTTIENFVDVKDLNPLQRAYAAFARELGVPIIFFRGNKNFHGAHANGISYYNVDATFSHEFVYWHEFGHWLKNNQPQLFQEMLDAADITKAQLDEKRNSRPDLTDDELKEEIICDAMSDVARRTGLLNQIGKKNSSLIQRIISWAKTTLDRFTDWFNRKELGLTNAQRDRMKDVFGKGVRQITDGNGNKIFRYNNRTHEIELVDGRKLPSIATKHSDNQGAFKFDERPQIKFSRDDSQERIQAQENSGTTQVSGTKTMYVKALQHLRGLKNDIKNVLDYGAGLGLGTDAMRENNPDLRIDSHEPNPQRWQGKTPPTFTDNTKIQSQYDAILNTNVLNVVEPEIRTAIVRDIGSLLKVGGKAMITTRSWKGDIEKTKNYTLGVEPHSVWIPKSVGGKTVRVYQKGFDGNELVDYVSETLGEDFKVEKVNGFGKSGVIVTRLANTVDKTPETKKATTEDSKPKYSLDASDNGNESFLQRIKNFISGRPRNQRIHKTMKRQLEDLSKMKIAAGHLPEGVQVKVDEIAKVIRTGREYDWLNILPAVGNEVAKQLGITQSAQMGNYIGKYLFDGAPNDTSAEAKEFAKAMRDNPDMREKILEVRDTFATWNSMSYEEQMRSSVQYEDEVAPLKDRAKEFWRHFRTQFVDSQLPIHYHVEKFEQATGMKLAHSINPVTAFRNLRGMGARAYRMIYGTELSVKVLQRFYPNVKFDKFKTIATILESIGASPETQTYKDFDVYIKACHFLDIHKRNNENLQQQAAVRDKIKKLQEDLKNATDKNQRKQIEKAIKKLDAALDSLQRDFMQTPETFSEERCTKFIEKHKDKFESAKQDMVRYSRTLLAILADSGIISYGHFKQLLKVYPNYVPLHREFDENADIGAADSMKHMLGSSKDMGDSIRAIVNNTFDFVRRAEKNKAKLQLANLSNFDGVGGIFEEVEKGTNDGTIITFFENGKRKYLQCADKTIVAAVNNMNVPSMNLFMRILRVPTKILRGAATYLNPNFMYRNILRDPQDAYIYSKKYGGNVFLELLKAMTPYNAVIGLTHALHMDEIYEEYMISGGAQGNFFSFDKNYEQETIEKLTKRKYTRFASPKGVLKLLETLGEYSELATRLSHFDKVKTSLAKEHNGVNIYDDLVTAALETRDLIDFARYGEAGRTWNTVAVFANPAIQGWDKFFRTFDYKKLKKFGGTDETQKEWVMSTVKLGLTMLPAIVLALLNHDKDWYRDDVQDWERETHWILSEYVRIPKGADIGLRFFSNLIESMLNWGLNNDPVTTKKALQPFLTSLPDIMPTALLPIFECIANYDMFRRNSIVPIGEQLTLKGAPELQYDSQNSNLAVYLGKKFGISPRLIDHFIYGHTGNMGRGLLRATDTATYGLGLTENRPPAFTRDWRPITGGLYRVPYRNPKIVTDYYNELDRQESFVRAYKLEKQQNKNAKISDDYDRTLHARLKGAKKYMQALSKQERAVMEDPKLTSEQVEEKRKAIQDKRIELCRKVFQRAR